MSRQASEQSSSITIPSFICGTLSPERGGGLITKVGNQVEFDIDDIYIKIADIQINFLLVDRWEHVSHIKET